MTRFRPRSRTLFILLAGLLLFVTTTASKCDNDGDGFSAANGDCDDNPNDDPAVCAESLCDACGDLACAACAKCIHPDAEELPDWLDGNCTGFADEPPIGFTREAHSMQGAGTAAAWYGDYVYLAAAAVLQVFYAPPGSTPERVGDEIEFRDWIREMIVVGDHLFVAARGDGVFALDLGAGPAYPVLAGKVSGRIDLPGYAAPVEALFHGIDAWWDDENERYLVAAARGNAVSKITGGVDAVVFSYNPAGDTFDVLTAFGTDVRSNSKLEGPYVVGLTEDGAGLYIGYGWFSLSLLPPFFDGYGELVYVSLDPVGTVVRKNGTGAIMDIDVKDSMAFAAKVKVEESMLTRFHLDGGALVEEAIFDGGGPGGAVYLHDDLLCFGTLSVSRSEEGSNLWVYKDLDSMPPTLVGEAGTLDWIFQLSCRDEPTGSDWVYVADEWGGIELWEVPDAGGLVGPYGPEPPHEFNGMRAPCGAALGGRVWVDGDRVFAVKAGAGLWYFDEAEPDQEKVAVEWIDRTDPGCDEHCDIVCDEPYSDLKCCCPPPPEMAAWPYPPAVFATDGASSQGRVALLGTDRNNGVGMPDGAYFMIFEEDGAADDYRCVYSEPVNSQGGTVVEDFGEILFVSAIARGGRETRENQTLRVYQHCPEDALDPVRLIGEIEAPSQGSDAGLRDVAVYGDYLFVAEVNDPFVGDPYAGRIHVFRWKEGELSTCADPDPAAILDPTEHLGAFCTDLIPYQVLLDPDRDQLVVGCLWKITYPVVTGGLFFYEGLDACLDDPQSCFDPESPAFFDNGRVDRSPEPPIRRMTPNVMGILIKDEALYMVDFDNGLYRYSFAEEAYTGFYPVHRGPAGQPVTPQLVESPEGVVPLYNPIAIAVSASGKILTHDHVASRVSILSEE